MANHKDLHQGDIDPLSIGPRYELDHGLKKGLFVEGSASAAGGLLPQAIFALERIE
jgi:hypothetical protein